MTRDDSCEDESQLQPSKRRKVTESCKVCRAKKTRCDGQRPACSACVAKGRTCEYNDATVPVSASTLADLEARLQRLEQQQQQQQAKAAPVVTASDRVRVQDLMHSPYGTTVREQSQWHSPDQGGRIPSSRQAQNDDSSNVSLEDPNSLFMKDITQIAELQSGPHERRPSRWEQSRLWPVETDLSFMVIPPRATADAFLDSYEQSIYPLFPVLHMPTFRQSYESLWSASKLGHAKPSTEETTFFASLNIVFALGCIHNVRTEPQSKLQTADEFYQRARKIMPLDALDTSTLEVVQYLALTAMYLTYTKYYQRLRNVITLAIGVARALGLHLDPEANSASQLRREMARRTWHISLTMERLTCFIAGQTGLTTTHAGVPHPAQIDDEYLLDDGIGVQPPGKPSVLDAYIATIKTFEVLEHMQRLTYTSWKQPLHLHELTEVIRLNETLDRIESSLPPHLKCITESSSATQPSVFKLQAEGVMSRILYTRLILLRPNILAAARHSLLPPTPDNFNVSGTETSVQSVLRTEMSTLCVQAALSQISILHSNLASEYRILSAMAVNATLLATTVIIAASLVSDLRVSLEDGTRHGDAIDKAFQVLDGHIWQTVGARITKDQLIEFRETAIRENQRRRDRLAEANQQPPLGIDGGIQMVPNMENIAIDFDFDNPVWDFQWSGMVPSLDVPSLF